MRDGEQVITSSYEGLERFDRIQFSGGAVMIKLSQVSKKYRTTELETTALDGVDFALDSGEFVAVMGPSGCGKSTLLNIVGLIDNPSSGEFFFGEREISRYSENRLADLRKGNVGFIFQSFNLIDELNVYENVELPLLYQKVGKAQRRNLVREALELVGLSARAKHKPDQLSGGQQQRVAVARAVVGNPKLILADEPTGNLDSKNGEEVLGMLTTLNEQGTTVLMVTHSPSHAARAHRIVNLLDGRVVAANAARDLSVARRVVPCCGVTSRSPSGSCSRRSCTRRSTSRGSRSGLACALLIALFVRHELSYDRQYADSDRIVRISEDIDVDPPLHFAGSSPAIAPLLADFFPGIETSGAALELFRHRRRHAGHRRRAELRRAAVHGRRQRFLRDLRSWLASRRRPDGAREAQHRRPDREHGAQILRRRRRARQDRRGFRRLTAAASSSRASSRICPTTRTSVRSVAVAELRARAGRWQSGAATASTPTRASRTAPIRHEIGSRSGEFFNQRFREGSARTARLHGGSDPRHPFALHA